MNVAEFLGNFRVLANALDGVTHLRRMVLTLAVQGRLVPQSPDDQPASEFLAQIALGRDRNFSELPESSLFSPTTSQIPKSWCWARFEDVAEIQSNLVRPGDFPDVPHLAPDNIEKGTGVLLPCRSVREDKVRSANHRFFSGQIVYSKIRPNLSKVVIVDFDGLCSADMYPIKAFILPRYLFRYMLSEHFLAQSVKSDTRVAMPKINQTELNAIVVPVPPLEEQQRIVAKVDELMRLCDRLEAQQQEREKLLPLLSRANHTRFVIEPTASHLDSLFQQPRISSTEDLRNTVLTLGVTGRLTQRLANDDSAMTLLDEMREQQALLHEAIVGRSRTAVSNAVLPDWTSKLPDSWETPLFDDVLVITSGITKGRNLSGRRTILLPYLRVANVQRWRLSLEQMKEIEVLEDEREKYRLLRGDVVMIEGGDWDKLGRAAIWNEEVEDCVFQNHIFRVRSPDKAKLLPEWVVLFVNSPLGREYFESCSKQTTNLASINMTQLRACRLPLPSTAEQKRIVQKVKYLLELVDRLEGKKSVAVETGQLFAAAAVVAITSTEFTEKERMKPPKTEVVTALKVGRKPKNAALAPLAALLAAEISLAPPKAAARADANRELTAKELWQLSGLEIDAFYRQLKIEMANDWIKEDGKKRAVKEVEAQ